jgi:hypothetical protein
MNVNEFYGDEAIGEDFLVALRREGFSLGKLFNSDSMSAARTLVDIAVTMESKTGAEYYANVGKLCIDLAKQYPDFYETLNQSLAEHKGDMPAKASLILYG